MKSWLLISTVVLASAFAAATASGAGVDISSNWSGYAVTGAGSTANTAVTSMSFTDVTGTWTQPAATCTPGHVDLGCDLGRPRRIHGRLELARADGHLSRL